MDKNSNFERSISVSDEDMFCLLYASDMRTKQSFHQRAISKHLSDNLIRDYIDFRLINFQKSKPKWKIGTNAS